MAVQLWRLRLLVARWMLPMCAVALCVDEDVDGTDYEYGAHVADDVVKLAECLKPSHSHITAIGCSPNHLFHSTKNWHPDG